MVDSQDVCLGTRAGAEVDVRGCALPADTDGDGVTDGKDQCPRTFDRSRQVDAVGCYRKEMVLVPKTVEKTFYFDFGSRDIKAAHERKAKEIAKFLKGGVNSSIALGGHADSIGASEYNMVLSQNRAKAVDELLSRTTGVQAADISRVAFGEDSPKIEGESVTARATNRRVQATVRTEKRELK